LGRNWVTEAGEALSMSVLIKTNAQKASLPIICAVAMVISLSNLLKDDFYIKWPNDIIYNRKKICGILTEAVSSFETGIVESVVIGIGVNVSTIDFPEDIKCKAGSLAVGEINRNKLIAQIVNMFLSHLANSATKDYLKTYRSHSLVLGEKIEYYINEKAFNAKAIGIDEEGGLIIAKPDGSIEVLRSGEISLRLAES
jgi:BirA family biotin operon repressor/biotin-[acetyl-CoA-carboxylase] ligase